MSDLVSRRRFLNWLIIGLSALAGAIVSVPIFAYLLYPLIKPTRTVWRDLGPVDAYAVGQTVQVAYDDPSPLAWAGQTARTAVWLRRDDAETFTAFAVTCTHLGCPVNWLPDARLFLCPCHGGVYYASGEVAGGPPPHPLFRHETRLQDNHVWILSRGLQIG